MRPLLSRHRARTLVPAAILLVVALTPTQAHASSEPATTTVQVLSINDFHGRIAPNFASGEAGAAVLAGAVTQLRAEQPNTLFVSAGDNIGASTFPSFIDRDAPTIDALAAAGLQLSAVGNHEFDQGFADLTDRVVPRFGGSHFAIGANVYHRFTDEPALDEYRVEVVDGVRVAFIGTVTTDTPSMVPPIGVETLTFGDELTAVNRVAEEIDRTDAADIIVLLTHNGQSSSGCADLETGTSAYAHVVREASAHVDAIISGHTHQAYSCEIAGPDGTIRPVIQAHQYGTTLGQVSFTVDAVTHEVVDATGDVIPLVVDGSPRFAADPAVAAIVDSAVDRADALGSAPIGTISADITRGGVAGSDRGVESALGNLAADMILYATSAPQFAGQPAQIAFQTPGSLRDDLRYGADGTVTFKDLANVHPFGNTVMTVELTGAELKSVLEEQWQPEETGRSKRYLGTSAGFSYTYVVDAPRGTHVVDMWLNGAPIDPAGSYVVAANSFLAVGGDNFTTFAAQTDRVDTGILDLQAAIDYFAAHPLVLPADLGRSVVVPPSTPEPSITPTPDPSATVEPTVTTQPTPPSSLPETPHTAATPGPHLAATGTALGVPALFAAALLLVAGAAAMVAGHIRSGRSGILVARR